MMPHRGAIAPHPHALVRVLLGLSCALATPCAAQSAQPTAAGQPTVLTVTGRGESVWEARQDAVRQALQQTVSQLVIADRAIDGDRLVRDQVLSTLNGFVEGFEVVSQQQDAGQSGAPGAWTLVARVTVSPSAMRQYIARGATGEAAAVSGNQILAAVAATRAKREANARLFSRLLDGFPSQAFDVWVERVTPNAATEQVEVVIGVQTNPEFIAATRSTMEALIATDAARPLSMTYDGNRSFSSIAEADRVSLFITPSTSGDTEHWAAYQSECERSGNMRCDDRGLEALGVTLTPMAKLGNDALPSNDIVASIGRGALFWEFTSSRIPLFLQTESKGVFLRGKGDVLDTESSCGRRAFYKASTHHYGLYADKQFCTFRLPAAFFEDATTLRVSLATDFFAAASREKIVYSPLCGTPRFRAKLSGLGFLDPTEAAELQCRTSTTEWTFDPSWTGWPSAPWFVLMRKQ